MRTEMGYQTLLTGFTGTCTPVLSGNNCFPFITMDGGVAGTLAQFEFHQNCEKDNK